MSYQNRRQHHESAIGHVTGRAVYTDDQRWPVGMVSLYPVLSPHAHARILRRETAAALVVPEVLAVLTPDDIPGKNDTGVIRPDEPLIPTEEVNYWGQPVAWVVGETAAAARQGAEQVQIEYEPLPALLSVAEAIAVESFHSEPDVCRRGDPDRAMADADHVLTGELEMGGQDHFYLETQAAWAIPATDGTFEVYSSTQHPTSTQAAVAEVLNLPLNQVVVTCLRMGGGFGGKESQANPLAAIAALAADKTGRPARLSFRRHQDMIITGKRHGFLARYQAGCDRDGRLKALVLNLYSDAGWSLDLSPPVLLRAMLHADNAYYIPHVEFKGYLTKTNRVSNTAFRGFGGPQGMMAIEDILDRIARTVGRPVHEVREQNFYHGDVDTNTTHYGQVLTDNRIQRVWSEVKTNARYGDRYQDVQAFNQQHRHRKRGLAITPVKFGISFNKKVYNQAGALVLIYTDGSIQLNHGGTEMGQGLHTKMLQVAARSLGIETDRIRMMHTSTEKVPNTSATAASSGSDLNGQAVKDACETLKERLRPVAAQLLGLDGPEEMQFAEGRVYCLTAPHKSVSFTAVVQAAYNARISLSATGFYRTPNLSWDPDTYSGHPFYYFAYGAAESEVEVDGFTGTFKLRQVDIVHDVGASLNSLVDQGQVEGGFVQGMGWLTMEELVWDEEGQLRTFAPSTYKIPTISEVPEAFYVHLLERASQDGTIYGSKAVGEPPFMLAFSVREAIRAAVGAFGNQPDWVPLASPATPEATLKAIDAIRQPLSQPTVSAMS